MLYMPMVSLRLSVEERAAWALAARSRGMTLTGFLKLAVAETVADRSSRGVARAVCAEILPEIERMLAERPVLAAESGNPAVFVPQGPLPFDPQCYEADLHRLGVVCNGCGGSMVAKR